LHFLDHPLAVGFDCAFGRAQRARDLFVGLAANDKLEDLPLARREFPDISANHVQLALQVMSRFMVGYSPLNCLKELVRRHGLGEKILGTRLDGQHRGRNIRVTNEKHDRQGRTELAQTTLELRAAQSRYPYVEKNTAQLTLGGLSPYQYILSERISVAKEMLSESDLSIADAALAAGFSSATQLNRAFRKLIGVTPTAFRRENGLP
jgi:hypothetical protein